MNSLTDQKSKKTPPAKPRAKGVRAVCGARKSRRAEAYINTLAQNPGITKKAAALQAGYSPGTDTSNIESSQAYQDTVARIRAAQAKTGATAELCLGRLVRTIKRKGKASDGDATSAIKVLTEITGERVREEIGVNVQSDEAVLARLIGSR